MMIEGKDVRHEPLERRRARLQTVLRGAHADLLRLSESFDDPTSFSRPRSSSGSKAFVSKRRDQAYRSGPNSGWVKVKTARWREANRDRWEMFDRR